MFVSTWNKVAVQPSTGPLFYCIILRNKNSSPGWIGRFLLWERVRSTLTSVQPLPKLLFSCEFQPDFLAVVLVLFAPIWPWMLLSPFDLDIIIKISPYYSPEWCIVGAACAAVRRTLFSSFESNFCDFDWSAVTVQNASSCATFFSPFASPRTGGRLS